MDSSFELNECRGSVRSNSPELGAFQTPTRKTGCVKHGRENEAGGAGWAQGPGRHRSQPPRDHLICIQLESLSALHRWVGRCLVCLVFKVQQCHLLTLWPWAINRPLCLSFLICQLGVRKVSTFQGCGGWLGKAS